MGRKRERPMQKKKKIIKIRTIQEMYECEKRLWGIVVIKVCRCGFWFKNGFLVFGTWNRNMYFNCINIPNNYEYFQLVF